MATLNITIPTAVVPRVASAFTITYGYQATINGLPNPVTLQEFIRQQIIQYIKNTVKNAELPSVAATATIAAETDINNIAIT